MSRFEERLAQETPIVADGGMGALLSSAVPGLRCPEEANLRAAESVLEVHLGYIRAGAELIETNSFGANRAKLARQFLADDVEHVNAAALAALARMSEDGAVLAALPSVGLASMTGQRIVFPHATPAYFAEFAAQARALGARLIGGCCGTTPAQVAAIREAVDAHRRPAGSFLVHERKQAVPFEPATGETVLARMLREGEFAISVQVDPPLGANPEALIETARAVRDSGRAQFVDVNDNPRARARMSGLMASVAIQRFTGVETIPHLTPRDSTITGLESLLPRAHAGRV